MGVFIVSFLVALFVSALCSLAESVLLSLSTAQIGKIEEKNPKIGQIWADFKKDLNPPITSILAINTAAHTIGASVAGASFAEVFGDKWIGVFSLIFTFLMLQYTEILPKTVGVRHAERLAFWIARPLWYATKIGAPIIATIRFLNRPFESKPVETEGDGATPLLREIKYLTSFAQRRKQIDEEQNDVIVAALELSKKKIENVASAIDEASILSLEMSAEAALQNARIDGHSRFPVCRRGDRDEIVGYVNIKDLIWFEDKTAPIATAVRKIKEIPADATVSDMLDEFVEEHEHIAVVVDPETNRNVGLLTLEDLVEELVGEIEDEYDKMPKILFPAVEGGRTVLFVGGGRSLTDVREKIEELFPNEAGEFVGEVDAFMKNVENLKVVDKKNDDLNAEPKATFAKWFQERTTFEANGAPSVVARNSRVVCGDLEFVVRRAKRGIVYDAKVRTKLRKREIIEESDSKND